MTLESGLAFFIAILIFAVTPGPGVFALLARAMTQGALSCFSLVIGMAISDIVYLVLACLGLSVIATHWGEFFTVFRIAGAIYLIYLGWKMWTQRAEITQKLDANRKKDEMKSFIQGFLISASNPKVILFYIAFLPTFMDLSALTMQDIIVACLLCLLGLMTGMMAIAFGASWARSYFRSERAMKGLNRIAGSIMMTAGIYIGTRS